MPLGCRGKTPAVRRAGAPQKHLLSYNFLYVDFFRVFRPFHDEAEAG